MKKKKAGIILMILGFILILINAVDYLIGFFGLSLGVKLPSSIFGSVLVIFGFSLSIKR